MSMHGDKYQQYIISCDEDERLSLGIDIKYVHQYKIYISYWVKN
jgi:hypothetical protein